jgi:hypothetical protein
MAVRAQPLFEFAWNSFIRAVIQAFPTAVAAGFIDAPGFFPYFYLKISYIAFHRFHFAVCKQLNAGMLCDFDHPGRQDALGAVQRGKSFGKLAHMTADRGFFFNQDHLPASVGDVERCLNSGNSAADYEGAPFHRDIDGRERTIVFDLFDNKPAEINRFFRRPIPVFMNPGAVFSQIRHFAQVWIQPCRRGCFAEGFFVHVRGTCTDNHAVQFLVLDGLFDQRLTGIRTHILVIPRVNDSGQLSKNLRNAFAIDGTANIFTTMADKYTNPGHQACSMRSGAVPVAAIRLRNGNGFT